MFRSAFAAIGVIGLVACGTSSSDSGVGTGEEAVIHGVDDRKDVFARTAEWVEENRLECSTFHILTPYPATPLFKQMEFEGRLLHRDWSLYDTAHCVFRPKHMTPEELEEGYAWIYRRLFSHASIALSRSGKTDVLSKREPS